MLTFLAFALFARLVCGHAFVSEPRVRGGVAGLNIHKRVDPLVNGLPRTCIDFSSHFPAGNKNRAPGSGLRSQKAAGNNDWNLYEPATNPYFVFRSGVCGDLKNGAQDHMRDGRFYCPKDKPHIVATYEQGGILDATVYFAQHHNGFMEFIVCDVQKCGGEISESCLRNYNVCRKLKRTYEPECETRTNKECPPVDPQYPTRWYLPCSKTGANSGEIMSRIRFDLPAGLSCDHCVLQWYMVAANSCNPPGLFEYFTGPRGPQWGDCPGQGNAKGGYRPNWKVCGGTDFPEEYYSCSDISINPGAIQRPAQDASTPTSSPSLSVSSSTKSSPVAEPNPVAPTTSKSPSPSISSAPTASQSGAGDPIQINVNVVGTPTPSTSNSPSPAISSTSSVSPSAVGAPTEANQVGTLAHKNSPDIMDSSMESTASPSPTKSASPRANSLRRGSNPTGSIRSRMVPSLSPSPLSDRAKEGGEPSRNQQESIASKSRRRADRNKKQSKDRNPVKYIILRLGGKEVVKIRSLKNRYFQIRTGGRKLSLEAVVQGLNPRAITFEVQNKGSKNQYHVPYRYNFEQTSRKLGKRNRRRRWRSKPFYVKVTTNTREGRQYSTKFWLRLV